MGLLLLKRLLRSLWRTRLRLVAVVLLVAIGVFAGVSFGAYGKTATTIYASIYSDTDDGVNLPDLWLESAGGAPWGEEQASNFCGELRAGWNGLVGGLAACEPRLKVDGVMFWEDESGEPSVVSAIWHGIDEGEVHRVWMPEHEFVSGRLAEANDEVVIDSHAASMMDISVGDEVEIGAGSGRMTYSVVGVAFHADHLYFALPGSIMPATAGTFVTGYFTDEGLERLGGYSQGDANYLLLDIEGTPAYDLLSTEINEGEQLNTVLEGIRDEFGEPYGAMVYDRSGVESVEFLRADSEGAEKSYPVVTGMLAIVAGITIFLSLQRLILSQQREIAILRTLGVPKGSIMPGFILAPIVLGLIGVVLGAILGLYVGAPMMMGVFEEMLGLPVVVGLSDFSFVWVNCAVAMVIAALSGIRPAFIAARLQPLEVLRSEHSVKLSYRWLQRFTHKLPPALALSLRSTIRKPMRLMFTFMGVGLSMLIFGSMQMMMDSIEDVTLGGIDRNIGWTAQVALGNQGDAPVVEWATDNNVEYERSIQLPFSVVGENKLLVATGLDQFSTDLDDSLSAITLSVGEMPAVSSTPLEVLVDEGTAHFLEWEVGSLGTVGFGASEVDVSVSGITTGEMARTMYFHRSDLEEVTGIPATSVLLAIPEGLDFSQDLGALSVGITEISGLIETFTTLMNQQQQFFNAILFLGVLIAIVVLFNTLLMNLSERDLELATLRVLGASIWRLGSMLLVEHLIIGVVGGILGAFISLYGAQAMIASSVQWAFFFKIEANWTIIYSLITTVVVISVALVPFGMWRISKMELVEKVKTLG
jgi:putative ABC transport system permease protein